MSTPFGSALSSAELSRERCPNCGAEILGAYCHSCGQHQEARVLPLRALLVDALGDLFSFDNRIFRTLRPLLLRPGVLTTEYLEGRRARYVPPFRLYLIISVLHFFVLLQTESSWFFFTSISSFAEDRQIASRAMQLLPQVMFFLVPVFALLMQAAYWRSRRFYVEHLIFALHFHAFAYLVLTAHAPLDEALRGALFRGERDAWTGVVLALSFLIEIAVFVYLTVAMRRVYAQSWGITVVKMLAVFGVYIFLVLHYTALGLAYLLA